MNMSPEKFKVVHFEVPFLDIRTTLMDTSLPLTSSDHDEFGNIVSDPLCFDVLSSYCPYVNLQTDKEYPAVIIKAYSEDYRYTL